MVASFIRKFEFRFPVVLWLVLFLAAIGSMEDIFIYSFRWRSGIVALCGLTAFAVFKATVLTWAAVLSRRWRSIHFLVMAFIVGFIFLSVVNGLSVVMYGFGISRKMLTILFETNSEEVAEFLSGFGVSICNLLFSWRFVALLLCVAFVSALVLAFPERVFFLGVAFISLFGIIFYVYVLFSNSSGRTDYVSYARAYRAVSGVVRNMRRVRQLHSVPRVLPDSCSLHSDHLVGRIVVVIGESASRDHLSLYGYPLPTTPRLDKRSSRLFLFGNAVASSTSTAENIPRLLSFMTDEPGEKEWYDYPSVLQLSRMSGYHTYWLSNQERTGEWSNLSGLLSGDADEVRYVGAEDSEDHMLGRFDEVLLPHFSQVLAAEDSLQLVFLHLMGSHVRYDKRFPPSAVVITADDVLRARPRTWLDSRCARTVAAYDNSIRYTDGVLAEMMAVIDSVPAPVAMIYLSDHGENVYDDRKYNGRDPKFTEVPFFIYLNDSCRSVNPELVGEIEKAVARRFSTSELPQMIMHIFGTRHALYDSVRDPLSSSFKERIRYVDGEPFWRDLQSGD